MNIVELQTKLQNLKNCRISFTEIGVALGTGRSNISKRAKENSQVKDIEIQKIENYFNVSLLNNVDKNVSIDKLVNIPYWSEIPEYLRDEDFDCVPVPRKVIVNKWKLNPENLYIVPVVDDGMSEYWYKIFKDDVLIIDTSENYVNSFGVYFATSQNNTRFWIREIDILANETIEFHRYTEEKIIKTYTRQELQEVDFRVIGKVIKNVSFRL